MKKARLKKKMVEGYKAIAETVANIEIYLPAQAEVVLNDDKVKCPRCGGVYHLKEINVYEVNDDGSYDWTRPIATECLMACSECGYEPCFDNDIGQVTICEED